MLSKVKSLVGYKLDSLDGEIGKVKEFYFDDRHWTIRYLVATTGNWFTGRHALISPYALVSVNKEEQNITIDLTKKQIKESPFLDEDKPVSRQFEQAYYGYYGYPTYWGGPTVGVLIRISFTTVKGATVNNGGNPRRLRKHGITICAALTRSAAITSMPLTARLATLRILSLMMKRGRFVISSSIPITGGRAKKFWFRRDGLIASVGTTKQSLSNFPARPSRNRRNTRTNRC